MICRNKERDRAGTWMAIPGEDSADKCFCHSVKKKISRGCEIHCCKSLAFKGEHIWGWECCAVLCCAMKAPAVGSENAAGLDPWSCDQKARITTILLLMKSGDGSIRHDFPPWPLIHTERELGKFPSPLDKSLVCLFLMPRFDGKEDLFGHVSSNQGFTEVQECNFFFVSGVFTWMQSQPLLPSRIAGVWWEPVDLQFSLPSLQRRKCSAWTGWSGEPLAVRWVRRLLASFLFQEYCYYLNPVIFAFCASSSCQPPFIAFLFCCSTMITLKAVKARVV